MQFFQAGKLRLMEVPGDHFQLFQVNKKHFPLLGDKLLQNSVALTFFILITVLVFFSGLSRHDHLPPTLTTEAEKCEKWNDILSLFFFYLVFAFLFNFALNIRQPCVSDCFLLTLLVCHISLVVLWLRAFSICHIFCFNKSHHIMT